MLRTAPDKHFRKITRMKERVIDRVKKMPGKILNLLNDTSLSEFSGQKTVWWAERLH